MERNREMLKKRMYGFACEMDSRSFISGSDTRDGNADRDASVFEAAGIS